jgi:hypothetical protein
MCCIILFLKKERIIRSKYKTFVIYKNTCNNINNIIFTQSRSHLTLLHQFLHSIKKGIYDTKHGEDSANDCAYFSDEVQKWHTLFLHIYEKGRHLIHEEDAGKNRRCILLDRG